MKLTPLLSGLLSLSYVIKPSNSHRWRPPSPYLHLYTFSCYLFLFIYHCTALFFYQHSIYLLSGELHFHVIDIYVVTVFSTMRALPRVAFHLLAPREVIESSYIADAGSAGLCQVFQSTPLSCFRTNGAHHVAVFLAESVADCAGDEDIVRLCAIGAVDADGAIDVVFHRSTDAHRDTAESFSVNDTDDDDEVALCSKSVGEGIAASLSMNGEEHKFADLLCSSRDDDSDDCNDDHKLLWANRGDDDDATQPFSTDVDGKDAAPLSPNDSDACHGASHSSENAEDNDTDTASPSPNDNNACRKSSRSSYDAEDTDTDAASLSPNDNAHQDALHFPSDAKDNDTDAESLSPNDNYACHDASHSSSDAEDNDTDAASLFPNDNSACHDASHSSSDSVVNDADVASFSSNDNTACHDASYLPSDAEDNDIDAHFHTDADNNDDTLLCTNRTDGRYAVISFPTDDDGKCVISHHNDDPSDAVLHFLTGADDDSTMSLSATAAESGH